jgi:hypothetical protein
VVTHLTTNPPVRCLNRAERTGSLVFNVLWSYVKEYAQNSNIYPIMLCHRLRVLGRLSIAPYTPGPRPAAFFCAFFKPCKAESLDAQTIRNAAPSWSRWALLVGRAKWLAAPDFPQLAASAWRNACFKSYGYGSAGCAIIDTIGLSCSRNFQAHAVAGYGRLRSAGTSTT